MNCVFPNPANILISSQTAHEKTYLLDNLLNKMNYSDIWIYSHTSNNYPYKKIQDIKDLNQLLLDITGKRYISDYLMIIIDEPHNRDIKCIQKLLKISKKFDIITITTNLGQLRNKPNIMRYIDVDCIFTLPNNIPISLISNRQDRANIINSTYKQLNTNEFVFIDHVNDLISKEYVIPNCPIKEVIVQ